MLMMAVATDLIGVHTVLGAFVVGVLVGQSPMMTDHIRLQLRGIVLALFAPVFFRGGRLKCGSNHPERSAQAGTRGGADPDSESGEISGCFTGGKLGGLSGREALALGGRHECARDHRSYRGDYRTFDRRAYERFLHADCRMAVTTTMAMPPMLRWALARIPATGSEKERLEREELEANDFLPQVERLLVAADEGKCGRLAAILGGLFVGSRRIMATVLDLEPDNKKPAVQPVLSERIDVRVQLAIDLATRNLSRKKKTDEEEKPSPPPAQLTTRPPMKSRPRQSCVR